MTYTAKEVRNNQTNGMTIAVDAPSVDAAWDLAREQNELLANAGGEAARFMALAGALLQVPKSEIDRQRRAELAAKDPRVQALIAESAERHANGLQGEPDPAESLNARLDREKQH